MSSTPEQPLPNFDERTPGQNGEPDVFIPGNFGPKLGFVIFSFALLAFGIWDIWGSASRLFFGEGGTGQVSRIVRESPGEEPETIRVKRDIAEGDYARETLFRYFVDVSSAEGDITTYELGVASRSFPYALVNENFKVIYFPDGEYAYAMWHHRTWAIGLTFLMLGLTFIPLSGYILWMVGKPIVIDPEDPEQIALEREHLAKENQA
jgi:hypothetical protein